MKRFKAVVRAFLCVVCSQCFLLPDANLQAAPKKNADASRVARIIPKFNPKQSKAAAEKQMRELIRAISLAKREGLSANASLVRTAMDFRDDIGEHQRTISAGAILKVWDTASAYGAIHSQGLSTWGSRGRFEGEELVLENIVPPSVLPEAAGYIGNLRLVAKSQARKVDAPLDRRDEAYEIGLRQVIRENQSLAAMREIQKSKVKPPPETGQLALSRKESEARWQAEVADSGEAHRQPPNIRLDAQKMGTPSKLNGNRYKLRVDVTNTSRHPTEVEIESFIVGYTDNGNKLYELKRDKRVLKLRRAQNVEYQIQTPSVSAFRKPLIKFDPKKSQRVNYRGYVLVARFDGKVIGSVGSDARLAKVAAGNEMAPSVITGASR